MLARTLAVTALVVMVCSAAADGSIHTSAPSAASATSGPNANTTASIAIADTSGDSPRDYVAESRASFTPENRRYARVRQAIALVHPFYTIAVCLALLFSSLSARMRDLAFRAGRNRYVRTLVYLTLFSAALVILDLPISWFVGFYWEHRFGLSNQGFGAWLGDEVKGLAIGWAVYGATGLVALAYRIIEASPRRWWLWFGAATLPLLLASVLITPLVFEPAFNKFTPLRDAELRRDIVALAAKAGIPGRRVLEADKSRQTRTVNAYVSGFGPSQRIVLWDTTLQRLDHDEILVVMGHEMGHYRLAHIWKGVALFSVLSFALFFACAVVANAALRRWGTAWRVRELHDLATMPLLMVTLTLLSLLAQPAAFAYTRRIETEADMFGIEVTRMNDAAARSFLELARLNRSDPDPPEWIELLLYTHPPLADRIRLALSHRPWEDGKPNRMFHPADQRP